MRYLSFPSNAGHWLVVLSLIHITVARAVVLDNLSDPSNTTSTFDESAEILSTTVSGRSVGDFYLRILPLGASITAGFGSSTGNGYRKPLRDQLRKDGWNVNMVGTKNGSTNAPLTGIVMRDNSVEAVPGLTVEEVAGADVLLKSLYLLPNLVLVNAGTNDCARDVDIPNIGTRMDAMLETIFTNISGTTVILSNLLPLIDATQDVDSCHASVNAQYDALVTARRLNGYKIVLADLANVPATYWNKQLSSAGGDYYDGVHPNDAGHVKLAAIWHKAIGVAYANQYLTPPGGGASPNPNYDDSDTFTTPVLPEAP